MKSSRRVQSLKPLPFDHVLSLILDLPESSPGKDLPPRLDALFRELSKSETVRPADEIEELIWALWISHEDEEAANRMIAAVEAMAAGAFDLARPVLDSLIEKYPDWAEAWNKRATLSFIEKRDAESLSDIEETLKREPRHFAAVSGFGQICLRHNRLREARAAFQIALMLNPHLEGLSEIINDLKNGAATLH